MGISITSAEPEEQAAAVALALQHLDEDIRHARLVNTLTLLADGVIAAEGIIVARDAGALRGVQICIPLPGASGLFWLPKTAPPNPLLEDQLVRAALDWLHTRGTKVAHAILGPLDGPASGPLVRQRFRLVTRLYYFEHYLDALPALSKNNLHFVTYSENTQALFHATLLRTYEGTLDCPELNGARTIEEVIAGHKAQGDFRPERWWLAFAQGQPIGVAMATDVPDLGGWDLSYVGIVPEARRQGHGRALTAEVLHVAKKAGVPKLTLAVDERNTPALQLYQQLGFISVDIREVYLYFWDRPLASTSE